MNLLYDFVFAFFSINELAVDGFLFMAIRIGWQRYWKGGVGFYTDYSIGAMVFLI
jgi:hypothetical protein